MNLSHGVLIVLLVIAVLVVVGIVFLAIRKRRTDRLRARFGPEYDRVVKQEGMREGEGVLEFREKRLEKLAIRPLSSADKARFEAEWNEVQSRFVDDPKGSVSVADHLVTDVMQARGYPMGNFEQRSADISVDHPVVVQNYRAAHQIALRHDRGQASTEDLRQAMVYYRALFQELLEPYQAKRKGA